MYMQVWCFLGFFVCSLFLENVGLVQLRTAFYKFNLIFKFSLLCLQWFCAATILLLSSYANLVSSKRLWHQLPIWMCTKSASHSPTPCPFLVQERKKVRRMAEARKQILQESGPPSGACDIPGYNNCKDDDAQLWYKQCSNVQLATNVSYWTLPLFALFTSQSWLFSRIWGYKICVSRGAP